MDVDTSREPSARINWSQVVGKAANGAKFLFEPIMPATITTISNTTSVMRDIRNATRVTKASTQRQQSNIKNSSENKRSLNLFKSAFDDIQSGSFSMDKINDELFEDYESETSASFDMPNGDDAIEMSSEEMLLMGNRGIAQSVIQSSSAQLRGLQESSKALINANIKSTQALALSLNNTMQYGFNSINTNLTIQNQKLDNINRSISSLLDFDNTNALEFYTKSIDMMAGIGKMMDNLEKSMYPESRKKDRVFDTSGGFDIKEYINYVKEGFKNSLVGTGVSMGTTVARDYGIMGVITDLLIPKALKEPLEKFDKSITRFFDEGFKRLGEKLNDNELFAMFGLGDIFGSKRGKVKNINLGAYMKDATPWNGIAQKALVEVIPELLTSIDSKIDHSEKRYFDYETGQFKTQSKIEGDLKNDYFDTFSIMLRESMDKLTESAQATGRSNPEDLITRIEALIDDQISGKKDTLTSRKEMVREMREFGISETGISNFIQEFQSGLEGAISRINDLYHEIGNTQHVYRNINNEYGNEYTRSIKRLHSDRKNSYRSFSFLSGEDPKAFIRSLQEEAGIYDIDLTDDHDFVNTISEMAKKDPDNRSKLIDEIKRAASAKRYADKAQSKFKFIDKFNSAATTLGGKIGKVTNTAQTAIFKHVYLGEQSGRASTLSSNNDQVSSTEQRAIDQLDALNSKNYDTYINQGESENDKDLQIISSTTRDLDNSPDATTVEGSITKSNNMLRAALSSIVINFKGFTSRLFGREGFFKKFWDSDTRKKSTDALKTKMFTGEDAVFKDWYEGARTGLKDLKDTTLKHINRGYDFLYDNTMQYMYNKKDDQGNTISYKDSDTWKDNKFVSQTLNREWRAEQKKTLEAMTTQSPVAEIIPSEIKESTTKIKNAVSESADNVVEAAENLDTSMNALVETIVGDPSKSPEEKKRLFSSDFMKKMKATMPKALAGAVAGAGVGLLNNEFSLLGSMFLPGGPMAGAIVGSGLAILSQTEAFKTFMFGKIGEDGETREGGLISQKLKDQFNRMLPYAVGGAVIGGLKGIVKGALGFDGGLGIMGMQILPGGIIGGAMLGAGLGILKNSESFKTMLFGEKGEDGNRSGKLLSDSFNKLRGGFVNLIPGLKKAGVGLGIGALTGAVLQNAGYIPAMLSLGGPVGMGIAGLGIGIASSTGKFNEWMFGSQELDENGNPIPGKRRKDGVLNRVTNLLMTNMIEPIGDTFKSKMLDLVDWTKDKVTYPFRLAFGPILDSMLGIKDNVVELVTEKFEALGEGIMSMMKSTIKTLFSPVTKIIGVVGKSIIGAASTTAKLAMSPVSVGLQAMQVLTAGKRRKEYIDFYKDYYSNGNIMGSLRNKWAADAEGGNNRNIFGKASDVVGAFLGQGDVANEYRDNYNEQMASEGRNHLRWRNVGQERREMHNARDERRANEKQWRNIDKYRSKIINKDLGGREVTLTDRQFDEYRRKFKKLGISEDYLQSSDDIMDLLYRKNDFKKKMDPTGNSGGLIIEETPDQKAARENTEKFQSELLNTVREVAAHLGVGKSSETLAEKATELVEINREQKDIDNAQIEITTGGKLDDDAIKRRRGRNLGATLANKFNNITSLLTLKKKKDRVDAEAAESAEVREGADGILDAEYVQVEDDKKSNPLSALLGKMKSSFSALLGVIGGSAVGSILLKGAKTLGVVGLLSGLGIGIMEMIKPGTQDKILEKTEEITNSIEEGNFYEDYIKPKLNTVLDYIGGGIKKGSDWIGENFPTIFEEHFLPKMERGAAMIADNAESLVGIVSTIVTGIVPPLANALVKVVPTVVTSFMKAIYNATIGDWTGLKIGDGSDEKIITDSSIPDATDKEALAAAINEVGSASYYDARTGKTVTVTGASANIDENGDIAIGYNKDRTANSGLLGATATGLVRGSLDSTKSGIIGRAGRAAATAPITALGTVAGTSVGAAGGTVIGHPLAGATVGATRGAKFGNKVGDKVVDSTSTGLRRLFGTNLTTERVGEGIFGNSISRGITSSNINVSADELQKTIQEATEKALANASSGGGNIAIKMATEQASDSALSNAIESAIGATLSENNQIASSKEAIEKAIINAKSKLLKETGSESYTELAETLSKRTVATVTKETMSAEIKSSKRGIVETTFKKIKDAVSKLGENKKVQSIIAKFTKDGSIVNKFIKGFNEIIESISKKLFSNENLLMKVSTKISSGLAELGLKSTPIGILFAAYDLANGAWNYENLFMVPSGEGDWLMMLISALFELVLGLSPIYLLNIIIEVAQSIFNKNWKCEWATKLYKVMAPEDGGFGLIGDNALTDQQIALQIATDKYNAKYGTNISVNEYNDKMNKGIAGSALDVGKSVLNFFGADYKTKWNSAQEVSADEIAAYKKANGYGLGYGTTAPAKINGLYAQGDSRWGKMPIGMLPDGSVATMDRAGCGPTALAAVANTVMGYGPVTPADMGAYAASNGYISEGGANAGLFTEGAARLGLNSSPIANSEELRDNLLAGRPAVLTGKSNSSTDPYTEAGHIVMADGLYGNQMRVLDPITGKREMYDINAISKNTEHAWAYSTGYGPTSASHTQVSTIDQGTGSNWLHRTVNRSSIVNNASKDYMVTGKSIVDTSNNEFTGIIDSSSIYGHNPDASGIDKYIMTSNYDYFVSNNKWYTRNYPNEIKILKSVYWTLPGRDGKDVMKSSGVKFTRLHYILSTQYFGLNGGTWGTITIAPQYINSARKIYKSPITMSKDMLSKIFAAAIIAENSRGNTNTIAPLSKAEKFLAYCNACRIMYGLENTLKHISGSASNVVNFVNSVSDDSYKSIVTNVTGIGADIVETITESTSTGIITAEQLKQLASQKNFFGKLALVGNIAQAKLNAVLKGTDFWTELNDIVNNKDTAGSTSTLTGASTTLQAILNNPQNIQEELLGKTLENVYRNESGGNYAEVINDTNNKASVGPYQANGSNAVTLLRELSNAQGISSDLRKVYRDHKIKIMQGKPLTDDEKADLSAALANEEYADEIKKVIDTTALKFQNEKYRNWYAGYYDDNIIKDLRTLPLLADMGNVGPGFIVNKGNDYSNSFMYNWTPVSKDKDFDSAYQLLTSKKVYFGKNGYNDRIKNTYDNLKNYTFKRAVNPGQLRQYFAKDTNPLGFGPLDTDSTSGDVLVNELNKSEKLKQFSTTMNNIGDVLINHLSEKTGISINSGLPLSTNDTNIGSDYEFNGSYDYTGEKLTNLAGTDRDRFIAAAKSQIGYLEKSNANNLQSFTANPGNKSYTKYAQEIGGWNGTTSGGYDAHWCNFFTSWAGKAAGIPADILYRSGSCTDTMNHYKGKGLFKSSSNYSGNPGDLVFFNWGKRPKSQSEHIGIVTGSSGDNLYTIEGNTSNGTGIDAATTKTRSLSSGSVLGFATPAWTNEYNSVNPSNLLTLGYGDHQDKSTKITKIDNFVRQEQLRKSIDNQEEFKVTPKDFESIGFGPGMRVDAGFDMTNTDGKLDQIFGLMAEWFAESKKASSAQSAATTNVNMIKSNTTNVTPTTKTTQAVNAQKYRDNLVNHHLLLSSKVNVRNTM